MSVQPMPTPEGSRVMSWKTFGSPGKVAADISIEQLNSCRSTSLGPKLDIAGP